VSRPWRVSVDGLRIRCYTHEDGARLCAQRLSARTGRRAMVWHVDEGPRGAWGYEPMFTKGFDPSGALTV